MERMKEKKEGRKKNQRHFFFFFPYVWERANGVFVLSISLYKPFPKYLCSGFFDSIAMHSVKARGRSAAGLLYSSTGDFAIQEGEEEEWREYLFVRAWEFSRGFSIGL